MIMITVKVYRKTLGIGKVPMSSVTRELSNLKT